MWSKFLARYATPILALGLCLGVVLGGSLPEFGNVLAYHQGLEEDHIYNGCFLVVGLVGICLFGLALCSRLLQHSSSRLVKK